MVDQVLEPDSCALCGGRGWLIEADGGAGRARPCDCRIKSRGGLLLEAAEIPPRYAGCRLATFKTPHPDTRVHAQLERALGLSRRYVDEFQDPETGQRTPGGLVFYGPAGVGKTHLAVSILREIVERYRVKGLFVEFTELLQRLQSSFDRESSLPTGSILPPILGADLLVLDELGSQRSTPWVRDVLYLIVNTRYTRRLPTIVTTNFHLEESAGSSPAALGDGASQVRLPPLSHRVPEALVSRLCEMAKRIPLDAVQDFRREVGSRQFRG